jgi:hypothetical protein
MPTIANVLLRAPRPIATAREPGRTEAAGEAQRSPVPTIETVPTIKTALP